MPGTKSKSGATANSAQTPKSQPSKATWPLPALPMPYPASRCPNGLAIQDRRGLGAGPPSRLAIPRDEGDDGERAELARVPFDRQSWLQEAGVGSDWGEPEYTIIERTTARPTLDVNGMWGGYTEPGAKTVLPSKATPML